MFNKKVPLLLTKEIIFKFFCQILFNNKVDIILNKTDFSNTINKSRDMFVKIIIPLKETNLFDY